MSEERLIYVKRLNHGQILALNVWRTGAENLVFRDMAAFERAKQSVEVEGNPPKVSGYIAI